MFNVFSSLRVYAQQWNLKNSRAFTSEEINSVNSAVVVDSQYGKSVCFHLKSGGQSFIPLSQNSDLSVGDTVNLAEAKLLTLERHGDADILRVEA